MLTYYAISYHTISCHAISRHNTPCHTMSPISHLWSLLGGEATSGIMARYASEAFSIPDLKIHLISNSFDTFVLAEYDTNDNQYGTWSYD